MSKAQRDLVKPQKPPVRRPVQGRDSCDIAGDNHRLGGRFHCQSENTRALEISSSAPHTRAVARPPKFGGGHRRVQDGDLGLAQFRPPGQNLLILARARITDLSSPRTARQVQIARVPWTAVEQDKACTAEEDEGVWEIREQDLQRFLEQNINRSGLPAKTALLIYS